LPIITLSRLHCDKSAGEISSRKILETEEVASRVREVIGDASEGRDRAG
jgi:hypothetical protein